MRADVQMAQKKWKTAEQILSKIVADHGGESPDLTCRRLAQVQLGLGDYPGALNQFAALLQDRRVAGSVRADVIRGFLDAAAHPDGHSRTTANASRRSISSGTV